MPKPRYTDTDRYPSGYVPAKDTDVSKTFKRIRQQQTAEKAEAERIHAEQRVKVQQIKRGTK
jgi:hypothetical protein